MYQNKKHQQTQEGAIWTGKEKVNSAYDPSGAYPSFCSIKQLGIFLLPPG